MLRWQDLGFENGLKDHKAMSSGREKKAAGFDVNASMLQMLGGFIVLRLTSMIGMVNINFTKEELLEMNKQLDKIKNKK